MGIEYNLERFSVKEKINRVSLPVTIEFTPMQNNQRHNAIPSVSSISSLQKKSNISFVNTDEGIIHDNNEETTHKYEREKKLRALNIIDDNNEYDDDDDNNNDKIRKKHEN